ncbi:MAG: glycoside hydrolase family 65 protein, partial [Gillisia sp.]
MNQDYIVPDKWSIIEDGFEKGRVESSESLFSIGNGAMGQRANFEEHYSGPTFQGSYIAGVYYPDKTRVGWWKNGYPEHFAKVLNAPNWIGIDVFVNEEALDLNTCEKVSGFRRELNMKEGWYQRSFIALLQNGIKIKVESTRFLSLDLDELGAINYKVELLSGDAKITFKPYIDSGITNTDANWDEKFWKILEVQAEEEQGFIISKTLKTEFHTCTFMQSELKLNGQKVSGDFQKETTEDKVIFTYSANAKEGDVVSLRKFAGYVTDMNHNQSDLISPAKAVLRKAAEAGFTKLLQDQKDAWAKIWEMADITIDGDIKAQQGIRFNIFQLNQTYSGKDERLNIG